MKGKKSVIFPFRAFRGKGKSRGISLSFWQGKGKMKVFLHEGKKNDSSFSGKMLDIFPRKKGGKNSKFLDFFPREEKTYITT